MTPDKLAVLLGSLSFTEKFAVNLDGAGEASVVRTFAGGKTTWTVTHSLNTLDVHVEVKEISTGETVGVDVIENTINSTDIVVNGNVADNLYRVVIIG